MVGPTAERWGWCCRRSHSSPATLSVSSEPPAKPRERNITRIRRLGREGINPSPAVVCRGGVDPHHLDSRVFQEAQVSNGIGIGLTEGAGRLPWWTCDRELDLGEGRPYVDVLGRSTGPERPHLEPGDFENMASELLNVGVDQLASKRQDRATARLRRMAASCGIERWGQRAGKLAEVLCKHTVVVSRWGQRGPAVARR